MDKITFREPKMSDVKSALEMMNSLVEEKAYITVQEKQTLKSEREYFIKLFKEKKEKTRVDLFLDINGKVYGSATVSLIDNGVRRHTGELGILLKKRSERKRTGPKTLRKDNEESY